MDMALIQGTISGLKTAADIAKSLMELKSMADVQTKVIELQSAILAAQSSALAANSDQAAMVEEVRTLKEEIARVKAWESQKQRYKLYSPWSGAIVYALKETMANGEPPHWICTQCYENGKRSILQHKAREGGWATYVCGTCKSEVHDSHRGATQAEYVVE